MINSTNALCTYIASNSIAFGPGTKPATVEKTTHQITPKIGASSVLKESDALPKETTKALLTLPIMIEIEDLITEILVRNGE